MSCLLAACNARRRNGPPPAAAFAIAFALALLVATMAPRPARAQLPATVRIGLAGSLESVTVGADATYEIGVIAPDGSFSVLQSVGGGQDRKLVPGPTGVDLFGVGPAGATVGVRVAAPFDPQNPQYVKFAGKRYRGTLQVFRNGGGQLTVVNVVGLEEYLYGVVPREVYANWPAEALKAQAVAARTYAVYTATTGRFASLGYDLSATDDAQVYGGVAAEDARTTAAVDATRAQVLTHQGRVINAQFHSTSGGHTENSENVYGWYYAYLRGRPDFDQQSPRYAWSRAMTMAEADAVVRGQGYAIGTLLAIESTGKLGVSGRQTALRLTGAQAAVDLTGEQFRRVFGLDSSLFTLEVEGERWGTAAKELTPGATVAVLGPGGAPAEARLGTRYVLGGEAVLYRVGERPAAAVWQRFPAAVSLSGRGWGHGLGMSQWGAYGLALQGWDYRRILLYYYTGVTLETR